MKPVIYRIDFPTGDFYIGSTCNFKTRRTTHLRALRKPEKAVNSRFAKLAAQHRVIGIYEVATGVSRETLHLLERDVIENLRPTLNINSPTPLPTRTELVGSSKPYGPYKSVSEFAAANSLSYRQAKYAAKMLTWEEWNERIAQPKLAPVSRHPPDPRKLSLVIQSPTGWEWLSSMQKVGKNTYERRRASGWSRWDAWTIPPIGPKKVDRLVSHSAYHYRKSRGYPEAVCRGHDPMPKKPAKPIKPQKTRAAIDRVVPYKTYYYRKSKGYTEAVCRGYEPIPKKEKPMQKRKLTCRGETLTLDQWSARLGITKSAISNRLNKGWSMEQALGYEVTPPELRARAAAEKMKQRKQHTKYVSPEGISGTATDHAVRLGISRYRAEKLANGWCSNLNALYRALGLND